MNRQQSGLVCQSVLAWRGVMLVTTSSLIASLCVCVVLHVAGKAELPLERWAVETPRIFERVSDAALRGRETEAVCLTVAHAGTGGTRWPRSASGAVRVEGLQRLGLSAAEATRSGSSYSSGRMPENNMLNESHMELIRLRAAALANAQDATMWRWYTDLMEGRRAACQRKGNGWAIAVE